MSVQIKRISKDQSPASYNPSLFPLKLPNNLKLSEPKDHITQEVEDFDTEQETYPFVHYSNVLYINLLHVSVKSSSDTSVQIKIQFRRNDNLKSPAEKVKKILKKTKIFHLFVK